MIRPNPNTRSGVALIIVLGMIVILTVILVAFVTQSRFDATASSSFSHSAAAEALASAATNSIISSLLYEIESESTVSTDNDQTIFTPITPRDVLPKLDASVPPSATTLSIPNLLRTSRTGPLYDSGNAPNSLASPVGTDDPAIEGRRIPIERWNYPRFLTDAQNASLDIPQWIYVNRDGPVQLTAWSSTLAEPVTSGSLNPDFVIGRYAYRIYDTSGLLDVNVAGHPELSAPSTERIGRKGGLQWASLGNANLPGVQNGAASDPLFLPNWRWPTTGYADFVDTEGLRTGFLRTPATVAGANRFFSRADLLSYIKSGASIYDAEVFPTQVTQFSRELNAPSWRPDAAPLGSPAAMDPAIPDVRVISSFPRRDGTTATPGEPLVNRRFPLDKIALLSNPSASAADIESWFGLTSNGDGTWDYSHGTENGGGFADGAGNRERLKTLAEIAAENREPNFFELLQAGILADSLGIAAKTRNSIDTPIHGYDNSESDFNIARHVIQIGTNIIDQYDEDNDPTVIRRTDFASLAPNNPDPDISGIENTPRIQLVSESIFRRLDQPNGIGTDGFTLYPNVTAYYQIQLWNPHRNADTAPPSDYRVIAEGEPYLLIDEIGGGVADIESTPRDLSGDFLEFDTTTQSFAEPRLIRPAMVTATGESRNIHVVPTTFANANPSDLAGFWIGDEPAPYDRLRPLTPGDETSHSVLYGDSGAGINQALNSIERAGNGMVLFQLQKRDSQGNWRPVQSLLHDPSLNAMNASELLFTNGAGTVISNQSRSIRFHFNSSQPPYLRFYWALPDPRTIRFGSNRATLGDLAANQPLPMSANFDFAGWPAANQGVPVNNTSTAASLRLFRNREGDVCWYPDRGSSNPAVRLADPGVANPNLPNSANPFDAPESRPIVLNRPFKSVAEMGYAGRDLPWRTLNLSRDLATLPSGGQIPTSADSALLDLFTVSDSPRVRAGVLNLNSASAPVIAALLHNASPLGSNFAFGSEAALSSTEANDAADAIVEFLGDGNRAKSASDPIIQNPSDITRIIQAISQPGEALAGWPKWKLEAVTAALADAHSARTWNLAIDVIAQTGRFPSGTTGSLDRFQVTAERRLVVHVAIDRITGEILDRMVEPTFEE